MLVEKSYKDGCNFIKVNNQNGLELTLCSFGASVYDLQVIDGNNNLESIVLTPKDLNDFKYCTSYYGKSVGRYSGRISDAKCTIDGKTYNLLNNSLNHDSLHGGNDALSFKNFKYKIIKNEKCVKVIFYLLDEAKDLPGVAKIKITYKILANKNEFSCYFEAISDQKTLMNLTNHTYFNLSGNGKRAVLDQYLKLNCNKYTKLDNYLITTSIEDVNQIMDFQKSHRIGKYIADPSLVNHQANGYDHCFIKAKRNVAKIATLHDKKSKRRLTVYTSYPAIVCYSDNYPDDFEFLHDYKISKHHAICLECQFIPNGINMQGQDTGLLEANQKYKQYIRYCFDIK